MPANAATEDGDFAVYGWGARDCNAIVAVLEGEQGAQARNQLAEWVSGYIAARNRVTDGVYDMTPVKSHISLVALARNICANNADQLFESVVAAMLTSFEALRIPEDSPVVSLSRNDRAITASETTLVRVQEFLIAEGFLDGSADGQYGPKTASAIEAWQEDTGLQTTGLPDVATLFLIAQEIR